MTFIRSLFIFIAFSMCSGWAQAEIRISIEGIEGELEKNVNAYLGSISKDSYSTSLHFQSQLEFNVRDALKALGYYQPTINIEVVNENRNSNPQRTRSSNSDSSTNTTSETDLEPSDKNNIEGQNTETNNAEINNTETNNTAANRARRQSRLMIEKPRSSRRRANNGVEQNAEILITIEAGVPSIIYESILEITGEAAEDKDFSNLLDNSKLNLGQVMNHGHYENLKSSISNLALQKGYFDGHFIENSFKVSPDRQQALVTLRYDSGVRYAFGETTITGSQIEQTRVDSLVPYKEGDPYQSVSVGLLNQNLSTTEWFSSVAVRPDLKSAAETKILPMNVNVVPQDRNQIETGLGYSTDVGVRGKLAWKKPWINSLGHSTGISMGLSKPEQTLTANYKIPLQNVMNEYYQVQYGLKNEDNRDTESHEQNLIFQRHWKYDTGWNRTIQLRVLYEKYEQASLDGESLFVLPGITFSRVRTRGDASMPMWGDKQSITLEYGDPAALSDTRIYRVLARTAWIRGAGDHRFLTRLDVGGSFAEDWDEVPPSLRFFSGGISTLRGYGYESISPKDSNDELLGGAYTATSSLEYQYRVVGNWWWALFVDAGDAWTDSPEWKTGVGTGVRWASPVGPVRLDFAYGIDDKDYQIHFTLGPEF